MASTYLGPLCCGDNQITWGRWLTRGGQTSISLELGARESLRIRSCPNAASPRRSGRRCTMPLHVAANMFEGIVYQNKDRMSAGIIVAGWDEDNGGTVYNIPLGGGLFKAPWAIAGSGSTYIYGYCDSTYRENWGRDETVDFVRNALALAMSRDGSSGGTIRLAIITKEGVERVFVPGDQLPRFWEKA
ncbi:hypothetical protein JCM10908_002724 [Rhodotorula pacifica]|uniref:uncharacterized protein n=1 Tax=Rhodotorula pacifica TaxID=1495444 RepID=UPI003181BE76